MLSVQSHITRLLVRTTHALILHAGSTTVMSILAQTYHIPQLKRLLKKLSKECVTCQKAYARTSQQMMGELPAARTRPDRPFSITGIDFAGPFTYKEGNKRKPTRMKGYICVYVCFVTKAVFQDLVSDLSTDAFLASLRRFSALYGVPAELHTDNGSNFVGANSELQRLYYLLCSDEAQQTLHHWASAKNITWYFSPSRAPHFGGLWESVVKAMKTTLKKVVHKQILRNDELLTLLYEAAAVLNSRPLSTLDSRPEVGISPLTPGHFLTRGPPAALPSETNVPSHSNYSNRWLFMQRLTTDLWNCWRMEYLTILQRRNKWKQPSKNLQTGDIVLLKDSDTFQRSWPMGRVLRVYTGSDGLVRAVDVKIKGKAFRRPIHKLVRLLGEDDTTSPRGEDVQAN